jgi:hypothetical protein
MLIKIKAVSGLWGHVSQDKKKEIKERNMGSRAQIVEIVVNLPKRGIKFIWSRIHIFWGINSIKWLLYPCAPRTSQNPELYISVIDFSFLVRVYLPGNIYPEMKLWLNSPLVAFSFITCVFWLYPFLSFPSPLPFTPLFPSLYVSPASRPLYQHCLFCRWPERLLTSAFAHEIFKYTCSHALQMSPTSTSNHTGVPDI